ncbi:mRNA surveillance protein pelota [Candidatus Micrarchaeota archaeon]|nr:mRNA surveillance protein pelota [Candidatus Micrarchaeota archaeon]
MKILKIDGKNNSFEVVPESLDDLWHLERVLEKGDLVSGKSERKIKPRNEGEKAFRKDIFVEIEAEDIELHESSGQLRVNGIIVAGKPEEFVELKAHHALGIEPGYKIKVKKKILKKWQVDRLEQAKKASARGKILAVVLDDEGADFAILKDVGIERKGKIIAGGHGKQYAAEDSGKGSAGANKYFDEVLEKVRELKADKVVFAGPGFVKNNLEKYVKDRSVKGEKMQAFFEATNSVGITGINELIKGGKLDKIVQELQMAKEMQLVDKIGEEVSKDSGLAAYGIDEVKRDVEVGAVEVLLVGERLLLENRNNI